LLAAVYRARRAPAAHPAPRQDFRNLPDRWRAALWLSEVEARDPAEISEVLGVSAAEAAQLVHLGRRGLAAYYAQAHQTAPEPIGPLLRSVALPIPGNLAAVTEARWAASGRDRERRTTHAIADRAVRPLWAAVGGLMAFSLMGIGLLAPGPAERSNLGGSPVGNAPASTCYGIPCVAAPGPVGGSMYTAFRKL
jgi:hypothetical protein